MEKWHNAVPLNVHLFHPKEKNIVPQWAINMQALEVSALCTLQKTADFNHPPVLCVFLLMTLVDVWYILRIALP